MKLRGKIALVTGAAQGIGRASALALARDGCDVVGFDLEQDKMQTVVEEIRGLGRQSLALRVDVRDFEAVHEGVAGIRQEMGPIDILINNAGAGRREPLVETTEQIWDRIIELNLKSVYNCCKAVVEDMIAVRWGRIINIASIAAMRGSPFLGGCAYAASKGGVIGLSKVLARELALYGICVVCLAPGLHDTPRNRAKSSEADWAHAVGLVPLGRAGLPEEIGATVAFLASPEADYITGTVFAQDGGYTMH